MSGEFVGIPRVRYLALLDAELRGAELERERDEARARCTRAIGIADRLRRERDEARSEAEDARAWLDSVDAKAAT